MGNYKDLIILIAEDDDGHAELIKDGLEESFFCNEILRFENGEKVWQFLSSERHDSAEVKKYLLLLDINMPKMNGVEVLIRMKTDARLKDIPVIMLTTTDDSREVEECYRNGCNFYITKPIDFIKFTETLKQLGLFIKIVTI